MYLHSSKIHLLKLKMLPTKNSNFAYNACTYILLLWGQSKLWDILNSKTNSPFVPFASRWCIFPNWIWNSTPFQGNSSLLIHNLLFPKFFGKFDVISWLLIHPKITAFPCFRWNCGNSVSRWFRYIRFLPKMVKNTRICNFRENTCPNLATLWNLVILAISATLPDGSNSKSPKIGQKRQNQQFLGEIHTQIWWRFWIWI